MKEVAIYQGKTKCAIGVTDNDVHFDDKVIVTKIKVVGGKGLIQGQKYGLNDDVGFRTDVILQNTWDGMQKYSLVFYDKSISRF